MPNLNFKPKVKTGEAPPVKDQPAPAPTKAKAPAQVPAKVTKPKVELPARKTAATGEELRTEAKTLLKQIKVNMEAVARVVTLIDEHKNWKDWGYDSFQDYVERELEISYKTMENWIYAFRKFDALGPVAIKGMSAIGYAKAQVLAPHITDDNCDELIARAKKSSLLELKEMVGTSKPTKKAKAGKTKAGKSAPAEDTQEEASEEESPAPRQGGGPLDLVLSFHTAADRKRMEESLRLVDSLYPDLEGHEDRILILCDHFSSIHSEGDESLEAVIKFLRIWEQTYDVQFVMVQAGEIVFGEETAKVISAK